MKLMNMDYAQAEARVMGSIFDGLKMTSREISEVTGKEHFNVVWGIKVLIGQGAILALNFEVQLYEYVGPGGGTRKANEYILDFKATYVLILGYDAVRRGAVIDRWMALEEERARASKPVFKVSQTYLEALEAHLQDQKVIAQVTLDRVEHGLLSRRAESNGTHDVHQGYQWCTNDVPFAAGSVDREEQTGQREANNG